MHSTGPLRLCLRADPAIDSRESQLERYAETLDSAFIVARGGARVEWYDARRLRRSEVLSIEMTQTTDAGRRAQACQVAMLGLWSFDLDQAEELGAHIYRASRISQRQAALIATSAFVCARSGGETPCQIACGIESERATPEVERARAGWEGAASADSRERMRRGWGCDCGGPAPRLPAADPMRVRIDDTRDEIARIVRHTPPSCPWRPFFDPVVRDVLEAMSWWETGQLALFLGDDPPNHLVEGIGVFRRALADTREHDRAAAKAKETPP